MSGGMGTEGTVNYLEGGNRKSYGMALWDIMRVSSPRGRHGGFVDMHNAV